MENIPYGYRMRRGKLVKIPEEWIGKKPCNNQMAQRESRSRSKQKKGKAVRLEAKHALLRGEETHQDERQDERQGLKHAANKSGRTDKYRGKRTGWKTKYGD